MTNEELEYFYTHYEDYRLSDNQFKCPICNKVLSIKGFKQHIRKEHYNKENGIKNSGGFNGHYDDLDFKEKISISSKKNMELRYSSELGEIKEFTVSCHTCGNEFVVKEREKQFPKKERYFCSIYCAHKYIGSCADPKNISDGVKKHNLEHGITVKTKNGIEHREYVPPTQIEKVCPCCTNSFITTNPNKECCSVPCARKLRDIRSFNLKIQNATEYEKEKLRLKKYRQECQFRFGIKDYPNEFDFKLIEEHGWYQAKNRGNNMGGVSRDHMYSVKQGFLNNIDPKIISHPANCKLVLQSENASKKDGCSITLDELMIRIDEWNKKYPNANL